MYLSIFLLTFIFSFCILNRVDKIIFKTQAINTAQSKTKDWGLRLGFHTQELTAEQRAIADQCFQQPGDLIYAINADEVEVPSEPVLDNTKTPSKRLRDVLYILWQQRVVQL